MDEGIPFECPSKGIELYDIYAATTMFQLDIVLLTWALIDEYQMSMGILFPE